jgi:hypothetical protein
MRQRLAMAESCTNRQDEMDFRDRVIFGQGRGLYGVGSGQTCISSSTEGVTITVCK